MLMDYRYHVISLMAVFLALGLGVLIGGALFSDENMLKSQAQIVNRLERDFVALREQNRELTQDVDLLRLDLSQDKQFIEWLAPRAVSGRLQGKTFALVRSARPDQKYISELSRVLEDAGANLVAELAIDAQKWNQASLSEYKQLAGIIAAGIRGPAVTSLEQAGYIQFIGKAPYPASKVLLLPSQSQSGHRLIGDSLKQAGLEVYLLPTELSTLEGKAKLVFDLVDEVQDEVNKRNSSSL